MNKTSKAILILLVALTASAEEQPVKEFYFEYFDYYEYLYSNSKKTEIGDTVELDVSMKYNFDESSTLQFGFETIPEENRFDNETSKFELGAIHKRDNFEISLDLELQTNDGDTGGTTFGLDLDSEHTYLKYSMNDNFSISFHPFNFDGEVGGFFNTWDVTRIYFIDGSPSAINQTQLSDEKIATKTIPGLVFTFKNELLRVSAGIGKVSYLHPTNANYDITSNSAADSWERREDTGYLFNAKYDDKKALQLKAEFVTHNEAEETGSLLKTAASLRAQLKVAGIIVSAEATHSKASKSAWRISRSSDWFQSLTPFRPIYSDTIGNAQDWLGKSDQAYSLAIGHEVSDQVTPYIFGRYQGAHFIFRERESAHILRTGDETKSHGGLIRAGLGTNIYFNKFRVVSEVEYLEAKNAVFSSSSEIRSDRINSQFKKKDYQIVLKVDYNFDGDKFFGIL